MKKCIVFFVLVLFANSLSAVDVKMDLQSIKEGITIREKLLNGVHVEYIQKTYGRSQINAVKGAEVFDGQSMIQLQQSTVDYVDEKIRVEIYSKDLLSGQNAYVRNAAWDGKVRTAYIKNLQKSDDKLRGTVKSSKGSSLELGCWQTALELNVFDFKNKLSNLLEILSWNIEGPESIGGYEAYKLSSTKMLYDAFSYEIWISPAHDFAPVQIICTIQLKDRDPIIQKLQNVKLEKRDNVWAIVNANIDVLNPHITNKGGTSVFQVTEYLVGQEYDDSFFTIDFPRGTWVYDSILEMGYIAGEGMWVDKGSGLEFVEWAQNPADLFGSKSGFSKKEQKTQTPVQIIDNKSKHSDLKSQVKCVQAKSKKASCFSKLKLFILGIITILALFLLSIYLINHRKGKSS